jgi:hypothetical protein
MGDESPRPASAPTGAVFWSYASLDAEGAQKVCNALRAACFDQSELRGGDAWAFKSVAKPTAAWVNRWAHKSEPNFSLGLRGFWDCGLHRDASR